MKFREQCFFFCILMISLLVPSSPWVGAAAAQGGPDLTADQVEISTPLYRPNFSGFEQQLGTFTYKVSWQGISAAEAKISVYKEGDYYRILTQARTNSFIDMFYRMRFWAKAKISAKSLLPTFMTTHSKENSRLKEAEITFLPDGTVKSVRRDNGIESLRLNFNPKNLMLDPFSAVFLARGLNWELGETKKFDTFNGKARYLISLTAIDRVLIPVNGVPRDTWVISPQVKRLTGTGDDSKKIREARIYVTNDKARDVLKIESEVFVGTVTTRLTSYAALAKPTAVAAASEAGSSVF
ncbi:MAG: DUF3108 domain-containing protein [Deltaproteobacteria bacterium]|nr:DUF3108 domain-containing protein [Deltaproteobacteria bacterium]